MRFAAITHFKPTFALKKWGWDSGKGGNSITKLSACKAGHHLSLEILAISFSYNSESLNGAASDHCFI
jgi:hypothetical protein